MSKIPKIIHLCWLSGDPYPPTIARCIDSWNQVMPDYEIMLWDKLRFVNEIDNRFASEAYKERKWAFVADYIRLFALYKYGGIYMDSDVRVYKPFDTFLDNGFFSCIEYFKPTNYIAIEAAVMGAEKGHPFLKECLELYKDIPFIKEDGTLDQTTITVKIAEIAASNWGFQYIAQRQQLKCNMLLYEPVTFTNPSGEFSSSKTYALHLCNGSWIDKKSSVVGRALCFINRYYKQPKKVFENIYKKIKSKMLR